MDFMERKKNYEEARETERRKIIEYLKAKGYSVSARGGCGITKYTSGNRVKAYDLSNFKYIEAKKNDEIYFISLNPFDTDPNSKSRHFLPDRLGVCKYKSYNADYVYDNLKVTDIDLPVTLSDLELLEKQLEVL